MLHYPLQGFMPEKRLGYGYLQSIRETRFPWRRGFHSGLDLNLPGGPNADFNAPIYSLCDGKVVWVSNSIFNVGWGRVMVIEHYAMDEQGRLRTFYGRYAHLNSINAVVGQIVTKDTLIAHCGKSGTVSPHLHFDCLRTWQKNWLCYIWGKSVQWVKDNYLDIDYMVRNWNYHS